MLDNSLFWDVLIVITSTIEWGILKLLLDEFSEKRRSDLFINSITIFLILITIIFNLINLNPNIKLFIGVMIGFILYTYSYSDNFRKISILYFTFWTIMLALDAFSISAIVFLNSLDSTSIVLSNNIYRLEVIILSKLLLLSVLPIVRVYKHQLELKSREAIYIIIPIITNIISTILIFSFKMDWIKNGSIDNLIILIVSSLLLISNISLIIVVGKIVKSNNIRSENKIMKEKIESQYRHYLRLQESQIKVKKLYHDMNNHVLCIENMYNKNEKAKDYIENLKEELQQVNGINSTGNMILDIILSEKKSICEENNISFLADINFSKCKFIDMVDICSIYSNLLDNAIEASKKIDEEKNRNIKIVGNIVNSFFVVKCENYKVNKIVKSNNKIFTDKKNKFIHGIGIDSIRNSVEKYNGNLAIEYSEEKFIVNIYIPLR